MALRRASFPLLWLAAVLAAAAPAAAETRLLRFPDVHGDRVVFTYAGDLWSAPTAGGTATRLTAHPGVELFARFSPDGATIAFTGQYDGDEQVYTVAAGGGVPRQLTWYPARGPMTPRWGWDNLVYGWTPDGTKVLFRSLADARDIGYGRLYTVATGGGLPVALPMPEAGAGDYSPDGRRLVYSPLFRDFRHWKRYRGGWAQDLHLFDLERSTTERITDFPGTDRDPMWIGETVYFTSDRTGTLNLYAYRLGDRRVEALTDSREFDVRWPSADAAGRIVYELAGELWLYDTRTGENRPIPIDVPSDGLWDRPARLEVGDQIEGMGLSPGGERALFVARGDVFTAPAEKGAVRNLTRSSGAHDRDAAWSPDGKLIAFLSDSSGEEEIYLVAQDGSSPPERLTQGGKVRRYRPVWSPDGERLAFSDKDDKLWALTVAGDAKGVRALVEVADEVQAGMFDYAWSPCGRFLAFSLTEESGLRAVWIWSVADGSRHRVTGDRFNSWSPAWDPQGRYLYFLADHEFAPQIDSIEWNYSVDLESYVYAVALAKATPHPFPPESDEVGAKDDDEDDEDDDDEGEEKDEEKGEKKNGKDDDAKAKDVRKAPTAIDFDGLAARVARVPLAADNYGDLSAVEGHLLVVKGGPFYYGRESEPKPTLLLYSLEERKPKTLAEDAQDYALSADGEKVLVAHEDGFSLYDVDAKTKPEDGEKVSTDGLIVERVPREEWVQIFGEVWRRYRDYFYVPNLHGYDWAALGERYRALLPHVGHRSDLNYVLTEMIAELNVSHAYVEGGDFEIPERVAVALPGARFAADAASGRYRIAQIFAGHNEEDRYRAPLTEIGVDARVGDYLLAIDGEELTTADSPYRLLRGKADRPVELLLNDQPRREGARRAVFNPLESEAELLYFDWVEANRRRVAEATGGRVGYLHLPDMGADGIREFIKAFYPQIRKDGLVVDVRGNGGGNVSQMVLERLSRRLLAVGWARNGARAETYPSTVFTGPMVALLNETSASDGDIFPAMFKAAGLGPLIGKRSWGGVVGISGHGALIDGGNVFVPEFGFASPQGQWIIEGYGVDPDIEVDNPPEAILAGRDPQLERAIAEIQARLAERPANPLRRPEAPVKTP